MGQGRSLPVDRSVAALQCQLLAASLNKLQTGLYKMCIEFVGSSLEFAMHHVKSCERITNEVTKWARHATAHSFCHTLTNKGIRHVINYDAFSLFDKLSLSSKYVPPTFIIVFKAVLLTHRSPARHNTCSHHVHDTIDISFFNQLWRNCVLEMRCLLITHGYAITF